MQLTGDEKKAIAGFGFCFGAMVGIALVPGTGLAGLGTVILCGVIGVFAFPLGLALLAGIGIGMYLLRKGISNLYKQNGDQTATPTLSKKSEPTPEVSPSPSAALISQSLSKSSSDTIKDAKVANHNPRPEVAVAAKSRASQHTSLAGQFCSLFSRCFGYISTRVEQAHTNTNKTQFTR